SIAKTADVPHARSRSDGIGMLRMVHDASGPRPERRVQRTVGRKGVCRRLLQCLEGAPRRFDTNGFIFFASRRAKNGEERSSSPPAKLAADERHWIAPVGVTQPAKRTNLKCVGRARCQIPNGHYLRTWQREQCPRCRRHSGSGYDSVVQV